MDAPTDFLPVTSTYLKSFLDNFLFEMNEHPKYTTCGALNIKIDMSAL